MPAEGSGAHRARLPGRGRFQRPFVFMLIFVNEIERDVPAGSSAGSVRDRFKPEADLLIVNGFPAEPGQTAA